MPTPQPGSTLEGSGRGAQGQGVETSGLGCVEVFAGTHRYIVTDTVAPNFCTGSPKNLKSCTSALET